MNFLLSDPQESEPPWELPSQCGKFWDLNVKRILFMGNPLLSSGKGRELHPVIDRPTIKKAILDKEIVSRLYFRRVGKVTGIRWMLVTQSAPFNGYKDMDPSEIPQFEAGEKEAIAQKLLEEAGTSNHYLWLFDIQTIIGYVKHQGIRVCNCP